PQSYACPVILLPHRDGIINRSLGSGQVVRHLTLDQTIGGSNPPSPARTETVHDATRNPMSTAALKAQCNAIVEARVLVRRRSAAKARPPAKTTANAAAIASGYSGEDASGVAVT